MNTSFRNSNIGFILYALIIIIIAGVFLITVWYMMWGHSLGTYSEGTVIGSVYLGGLQEDELEQKVNQKVDIWLDDPTIVFELTYQGYSYQFDRNLIYFDLDESKENLKTGQANDLIAKYQILDGRDDNQLVVDEILDLEFLRDIIDNVNVDQIIFDILSDASLMKTYSSKEVESYLITPEDSYVDIASVSVDLPEGVEAADLIAKVTDIFGTNGILFESKGLFDMVVELTTPVEGVESYANDIEMTILSQAMMELSHETNFTVHEVHYLPRYNIGDNTFETFNFGSNVTIYQPDDYSFSLYNSNDSDYLFRVEEDTVNPGNLLVTLYGLDFVDTIDITIDVEPIAFFTQTTNNPGLVQLGEVGAVVIVHRTISDLDENILFDQDIIFEYYQPKSEIVLDE